MLDGNSMAYIGLGFSGLITAAGVALPFSKTLQNKVFPRPQEDLLSDLLPFHHFMDDSTILCKSGVWSSVIAIDGMITDTLSVDERIAEGTKRWKWLDKAAEEGVTFTIMTHRQLIKDEDVTSPDAHPVLQKIDELWQKNFEKGYANRHYLLLSKKPSGNLNQDLAQWEETKQLIFDFLEPYRPRVLKENETETGLLSFWSRLINSFDDHPVFGQGSFFTEVSRRLVSSVVNFLPDQGIIEWQDGPKKRYGAIISIHEWSESIDDDMMQDILSLPCEMRWVHYAKGFENVEALKSIKMAILQTNMPLTSQQLKDQHAQAQESIQSKANSLYEVQSYLILETDSRDHLERMIEKVRSSFRLKGLKPVQETQAMETMFLSQFPSYETFLVSHRLFSNNVAALCPFEKQHLGLRKTDWGESANGLRPFKTSSGSNYAFQLHVSDKPAEVAHSLVLGGTGSGKSTLFQHLIGGAMTRHPDLRAYIFDRFLGTKVFTTAVGGKHIDLGVMGDLQLNPLHCEDSPDNRAFLSQFLNDLANIDMDEKSLEVTGRAMEEIFDLPIADRSLSKVYDAAFQKGNPLTHGLKAWVKGGVFSRYFNGEVDDLDVTKSQLVTFEMASLEKTGPVYTHMINFIMHRIRDQLRNGGQGSSHLVFVDESAPMLENQLFQNYAKQLLFEHRKLRGSVTLCFQTIGSVMKSPIREAILSQCQTVFIFPNPAAQRDDYSGLDLNDSQFEFIKGIKRLPLKRGVLVKRIVPNAPSEAIYLDVDLSPLGKHLKLYSSGVESVNLMKSLQQQWGEQWIPHYLEEAK